MKKIILTLGIAMMGLVLLPAVGSDISAQSGQGLTAKIPFEFIACREKLPAGKYTIERVSAANRNTLIVRSTDGRSVDVVCTFNVQTPSPLKEGELVFNRYNNQYFLTQAWWPGELTGLELVKTEIEEALIKEMPADAAKKRKRERVTIKIVVPDKQ